MRAQNPRHLFKWLLRLLEPVMQERPFAQRTPQRLQPVQGHDVLVPVRA